MDNVYKYSANGWWGDRSALRMRLFGKKRVGGAKVAMVAGATTVTKAAKPTRTDDGLPDKLELLEIHEPRKMAAHTGNIRSYIMGKVMGVKAILGIELT